MQENRLLSLGQEHPLEKGAHNPLSYSCRKNPTDRGAWQAPWCHKEPDTTQQLSTAQGQIRNLYLMRAGAPGGAGLLPLTRSCPSAPGCPRVYSQVRSSTPGQSWSFIHQLFPLPSSGAVSNLITWSHHPVLCLVSALGEQRHTSAQPTRLWTRGL